jgi:RNA polymerase sigma factor (sigma-70 family)
MTWAPTQNLSEGDDPPERPSPFAGFDSFYLESYPKLFARARMIGSPSSDIEDLVHDALVSVLPRWPELMTWSPAARFAFVRTALINAVINAGGRRRTLSRIMPRLWSHSAADQVEAAVLRNLEAGAALSFLETLPPMQREALVLAWDEYDIGESAALMGVTKSTVSSHLSLARKKLNEHLRGQEGGQ